MNSFDWIQKYIVALFIFDMLVNLHIHGKQKTRTTYDFRMSFINWIVFLPISGRVLGWW